MTKNLTTSRFMRRLVVLGTASALALSACSSSDGESTESSQTSAASGTDTATATAESSAANSDNAVSYPLTLPTAFGDVTIKERPERVATLGFSDEALALAMGANVVAAPISYSKIAGASEDPKLPYVDAPKEDVTWVNPRKLKVEEVAATHPDVILAHAAFMMDQELYEKLSAIAPVVTYQEELYKSPAPEIAERIGKVLGVPEKAKELVEAADKARADFKKAHPQLDGSTYLYGQAADNQMVMLVKKPDASVWFMEQLGLTPLPAVAEMDPGKVHLKAAVAISYENASVIDDADLLLMTFRSPDGQKEFETNPAIKSLPIMQDRYVTLGSEVATALQDPNVVAVPWLLKKLEPAMAKVHKN